MLYKTIKLSEKYPDATLTTYVSDDTPEMNMPPRRAIIVCPGGGYRFLSDREAEPIVKLYLAAGLNVFLLRYSVGAGAANYAPLIQASLAIKHVRENAEQYNVDPNYVFITGFSAGGHLAASTGTLWNIPQVLAEMGDAPLNINRPTGMILCYAVLTYSHKGSFCNLCGTTEPTADQLAQFELERYVTPETPPAFLWHTLTDKTVTVQSSLTFAQALKDNGVPFELHIYPEGAHGLSLCNEETCSGREDRISRHNENWSQLAIRWIKDFK